MPILKRQFYEVAYKPSHVLLYDPRDRDWSLIRALDHPEDESFVIGWNGTYDPKHRSGTHSTWDQAMIDRIECYALTDDQAAACEMFVATCQNAPDRAARWHRFADKIVRLSDAN